MNVKELKEFLNSLDPEMDDCELILQKDSEGNGFSPLSDVSANYVYVPDSSYSGDVYSKTWTAEDACMTEEEWAELLKKKNCIVFAPIN